MLGETVLPAILETVDARLLDSLMGVSDALGSRALTADTTNPETRTNRRVGRVREPGTNFKTRCAPRGRNGE
jgi:hypothetical protein